MENETFQCCNFMYTFIYINCWNIAKCKILCVCFRCKLPSLLLKHIFIQSSAMNIYVPCAKRQTTAKFTFTSAFRCKQQSMLSYRDRRKLVTVRGAVDRMLQLLLLFISNKTCNCKFSTVLARNWKRNSFTQSFMACFLLFFFFSYVFFFSSVHYYQYKIQLVSIFLHGSLLGRNWRSPTYPFPSCNSPLYSSFRYILSSSFCLRAFIFLAYTRRERGRCVYWEDNDVVVSGIHKHTTILFLHSACSLSFSRHLVHSNK